MFLSIAIMQPYFFPYLGYWQLLKKVDHFILYDNIKFTKKSWIRRNRILLNGKDSLLTLPLKNDSDALDIKERILSDSFLIEREKILNKIKIAYQKSPQFETVFPIIEKCLRYDSDNLFLFIHHSIVTISNYLGITTPILISSTIDMDHSLKNKERVIASCKALSESVYINPIGGIELYDKKDFYSNGIDLRFIKTGYFEYKQFENDFIANLSIIDVMMFNTSEGINRLLENYEIIK